MHRSNSGAPTNGWPVKNSAKYSKYTALFVLFPTFLFVLFRTFWIFLFFCQYSTFLYPSISADTQVFFSADTWSFFIHWSRQSNCGNTPRVRVDLGTTWPGSACLCVCVVRVWKMQLEVEILKFVQISKYLFELRVLYMLVFLWQCVMWYVLLLLGFLR